jgi:hypothetical protein
VETRLAFDDTVERRGPDDFFLVKKGIEASCQEWSLERLLGCCVSPAGTTASSWAASRC